MRWLVLALICCATLFAQTPQAAPQSEPSEAVKAARKLHSEGKYDEAIAAFKKIADEGGAGAWEGHLGMGIALDLKGDYTEARKHIQAAIDTAPADSQQQALRAMGMSYGFTRDTKNAELFGKQVFDYRVGKNDLAGAAEAANELARVLLESGDVNGAEKWYKTGYETIKKSTDLDAKEKDLWEFRWHSALARIAARRGKKAEAKQHADAAKATFDRGIDPSQAVYVPYVYGYTAFYAGDYKNAITQFSKANQNDPFNLVMIAQAYEKTGNKAKAREYYQKVMQSSAHNPTNAYARPIAKEKLKS
jgi:tetratricopeptide (TPR) repeat protein